MVLTRVMEVDGGSERWGHVVREDLQPVWYQPVQYGLGGLKAAVATGLAAYFIGDSFGGAEPPEDADQQTLFVDREEVQRRTGVDDRPVVHPVASVPRSVRSRSMSASSAGWAQAIDTSSGTEARFNQLGRHAPRGEPTQPRERLHGHDALRVALYGTGEEPSWCPRPV